MTAGGKRPGAGRKPGSRNQPSPERELRVAATGATPLDVMLDEMRYHYRLATNELKKRKKADAATVSAELKAAREAAVKAAPYIHPQLATLQSNVNLTGRLTLEQLVEASMPVPKPANSNAPAAATPDEAEVARATRMMALYAADDGETYDKEFP